MKNRSIATASTLFALFLLGAPLPAQGDLAPAILSLESEANGEQIQGGGDVFVPLSNVGRGHLFFDAGGLAQSDDYTSGYAGLAYRSLAGERSVYGIYSYADWRNSQFDNNFYGLGAGGELRLRWLELNAHYHLPIDDAKESAESFSDIQNFQNVSQQTSSQTFCGDIFATGHTLQIRETTVITTRTTTTNTRVKNQYERFEAPRQYLEAEAGVPIIPFLNTWAYGGYYHFEDPLGSSDVDGFRGRIAARPVPAIELGVTYYQDGEEIYGEEWTGNVSVSLPLGAGENSWKEAFQFTRGLRSPVERMAEPIRRNKYIPPKVGELELVDQIVKTKVDVDIDRRSFGQNRILKDDIIFVRQDAGNANDANPGTWENPKVSVVGGAAQSDMNFVNTNRVWTVWTEYSVNPYVDQEITVQESGHFISSYTPLAFNTACGVKIWGGNTPRPLLNGTSHIVFVENDINSIHGYEFQGIELAPVNVPAVIYGRNIGDLIIEENIVTQALNGGIGVENSTPLPGGLAIIRNNEVHTVLTDDPDFGGIHVLATNNSVVDDFYRVEITNNLVDDVVNTSGIIARNIGDTNSTLDLLIADNLIQDVLSGITVVGGGGPVGFSRTTLDINNNLITGNLIEVLGFGISLDLSEENAIVFGSITQNIIESGSGNRPGLAILSAEDSSLGDLNNPFLVANNSITHLNAFNIATTGALFIQNFDGVQHLQVHQNFVDNQAANMGSGIALDINSTGALSTYDFVGNTIRFGDTTSAGISANIANVTDPFNLNIQENVVYGNGAGSFLSDGVRINLNAITGMMANNPITIIGNIINPLLDGQGNNVQGGISNGYEIIVSTTPNANFVIHDNEAYQFDGAVANEGNGILIETNDAMTDNTTWQVTNNNLISSPMLNSTGIRINHDVAGTTHTYVSPNGNLDTNLVIANILSSNTGPATEIGDLIINGMDILP